jgi:hypothetical protein
MNTFFIVLLVLVVAVVAVDAIARLDERRKRPTRDPLVSTTQKIIVDLTKRR